MSDTSVFQLAGAAVVLVSLFIAIYYRGRAKLRQKRSGRSSQRVSNPLSLRLAGVAHLLVVVSFLFAPQLLSWSYYTAPNWLRWTGVAGAAVSSLLVGWVLSALGDNVTRHSGTRQGHTLVTHGPYRWVRHPLYTVGIILHLCFTLIASSWLMLVTLAAVIVALARRTYEEEKNLLLCFGEKYLLYMARTGKYLPFRTLGQTLWSHSGRPADSR